jgi:cellulose synthase operon protein YhjQ
MKKISFLSANGGVGRTTLTVNLAAQLASQGARVLVVDLDPQNAARLSLGLDIEDDAGLAREGIKPSAIFDSPFRSKGHLHFIPFGRLNQTDLRRFENTLESQPTWLKESLASLGHLDFDFVLIDAPAGRNVFCEQAFLASDLNICLIRADAASLAAVQVFEAWLSSSTSKATLVGRSHRLVNFWQPGRLSNQVRFELQKLDRQKGIPISVHQDQAFETALAQENLLLEITDASAGLQDLRDLAGWVTDQLSHA